MGAPLQYCAVALLVAAAALPIAFTLFRRFPDGGAGLAFALGTTLAGFIYFALRVLEVLPAGRGGAVAAVAVLAVVGAGFAGRERRFRRNLERSAAAVVVMAGLFVALFFAYTAVRSYNPEVSGTEQPMDLMYLNAAMHSESYPPEDPWLAGERASYYYFGYVQAAVLTQVAGLEAETGYNLSLAYVFAAAGTGMASLAFAAGRWVVRRRRREPGYTAALAAVGFLLFAGTLWGVFAVAAAHEKYDTGLYETFGVESLLPCDLTDAEGCYAGRVPRTEEWYPTQFFWWFGGTRVIPGTITEFPFFSFLLGDLHPHVMSIPLVLLVVGAAASTWRGRGLLDWRSHLQAPGLAVVLAVLLGALAFQNAWDFVTFTALFGVAAAGRNVRHSDAFLGLAGAVTYVLPLLLAGAVLYLPWLMDFSSQAGGLYPYVTEGTRPAHLLLQYGPVLVPALGLLLALEWRYRTAVRRTGLAAAAVLAVIPLLGWLALADYHGRVGDGLDQRSGPGWVSLALLGGFTATFCYLAWTAAHAGRRMEAFAAASGTFGTLLLYGAELFFVRDVFFGGGTGDLARMNTVFKLSYQAWILLALCGGIAVAALVHTTDRRPPMVWGLGFAPVMAIAVLSLVYPVTALPGRTEGSSGETTVDGLAFVARFDPDEYALTAWIRENLPRGTRIIEGSGRGYGLDAGGEPVITSNRVSYSDASRISGRTGRPTLIGWAGHEVQWRGESRENRDEYARRQDLMDRIYLSRTAEEAVALLGEAGAEYVVVGSLERQRYTAAGMADFASFMEPVFKSGDLAVYRLKVRWETQL